MTKTLFDLSYQVNVSLGNLHEGVADSAGTTTTLIDSKLAQFGYTDDWYNYGKLYILYDAGGAGAAPEGEWTDITDFESSTGTFTISALTVATGGSDRYAASTRHFPHGIIVQKINEALLEFELITTDTSSVTIADEQTAYSLPVALMDLREIYIQGQTTDSDSNLWTPVRNWRVEKSATGSVDKLIFDEQLPSGYTLKLVYLAPHANLYNRTDKLDERIPWQVVIAKAVVGCLMWALSQPTTDKDSSLPDRLAVAQARVDRYELRYRQKLPRKQGRIMKPWDYEGSSGRYGEYIP